MESNECITREESEKSKDESSGEDLCCCYVVDPCSCYSACGCCEPVVCC